MQEERKPNTKLTGTQTARIATLHLNFWKRSSMLVVTLLLLRDAGLARWH